MEIFAELMFGVMIIMVLSYVSGTIERRDDA